jgi:hypothetical protein
MFAANWQALTYPVNVLSNSSLSGFQFSQPDRQISLNVTGPKAMTSFCNVTIPKSLLGGPWTVKLDGSSVTPTVVEDSTYTYLYLPFTQRSTDVVTIEGAWVVPEFPTASYMCLLLVTTLLAILFTKRPWLKKT